MARENLILDNDNNFKKFKNNILEFDKLENFDKIKKEIDFRNLRERQGLWDDKDLLKHRAEAPQVEILPGTVDVLAGFVTKESQRDAQGRVRYLLTSGLAVEVITGATRFHHDIDLVLFDYRNNWWTRYVTDNVTPDRYWAEMKFDPAYLEETAWTAQFQAAGVERTVSTVHPAIILVQKLSNAWGRPPRERDIADVGQLMRYWQEAQNGNPEWRAVIEAAIAALPQTEQVWTRERLAQYPTPEPVLPKGKGLFARFAFR